MALGFLDSLLSGAKGLAAGQGGSDLTGRAKEAWAGQSTLTKGAIAGGLLGVLLSGNARRLIGTGVQVGGAALIGGLAYKAYDDWKNGKAAEAHKGPIALPEPSEAFLPHSPAKAEDLALRLVAAMVAATKADGHVSPQERARVAELLPRLGLGPEAQQLIEAELDSPLDFNRIAGLAQTEAEAAEIYAASLMAVDPNGAAEKGYLAMLAARLNLSPGLVAHLHANID